MKTYEKCTNPEEVYSLITLLEHEIELAYKIVKPAENNPLAKVTTCLYCGEVGDWKRRTLVHKDDCPVTLMRSLRKSLGIPSFMERILNANKST